MVIRSSKWKKKRPPKRVLAIRLQAMGDLVITLPYLQSLKNSLPGNAVIDLLTREEVDPIPRNLLLFNCIYSIKGGRNFKWQCFHTLFLLPKLITKRYEVVLDLQNNLISRVVRKIVNAQAWSEFDKVSATAAGGRTRATIEAAGIGRIMPCYRYQFKTKTDTEKILDENGWKRLNTLVILNPAGAFPSRNWPLNNYIHFAFCWLEKFPASQFVVLGTKGIEPKAEALKKQLRGHLINLTNKTSVAEAFAIIQQASFVLSEDSGLMHMAWVSGIPTVALFGSTRSDWSQPLGEHSLLLGSSDLPCGSCMLIDCKFGTTHCLTRFTPHFVFEKALSLVGSNITFQKV